MFVYFQRETKAEGSKEWSEGLVVGGEGEGEGGEVGEGEDAVG